METKISGVYVMQASNGLSKIGKANNVDMRRWQLEQGANMFNAGEKLTIKIVKFYPLASEGIAFALEAYLHERFADYQAGTSSREVFAIEASEIVKIADIWHHAFSVAQTVVYQDMLLKSAE